MFRAVLCCVLQCFVLRHHAEPCVLVSLQGRTRRGSVRARAAAAAAAAAGAGAAGAGQKLSTERAAQLEDELAALRAALAEAEAREMEAQMAVVSLATDNSTLQAQLQGMRAQKQQLETMLLFGGATFSTSGASWQLQSWQLVWRMAAAGKHVAPC